MSSSESIRALTIQRRKILIAVRTYPQPTAKEGITVCTAALTENGEWLRLYPTPRELPQEKRLKKYLWVEVDLRRHRSDSRPETFTPDFESMKPAGWLDSEHGWRARKAIVDKAKVLTLAEWETLESKNKASLGIIKPYMIEDIVIEKDDETWSENQIVALSQGGFEIFEDSDPKKPPKKIPFVFKYEFREAPGAKVHRLSIRDWELGALYNRTRAGHDEESTKRIVKEKFLNTLCGNGRDTKLFIGTHHRWRKFMCIGVFWPPKEAPSLQPTLLLA